MELYLASLNKATYIKIYEMCLMQTKSSSVMPKLI